MRREAQSHATNGHWKRRLEDGLYGSGLLRAFHGLSRRYELVSDGKTSGRVRRVRKAKFVVLGYHRVGTDGVPFYCTLHSRYLLSKSGILPGIIGCYPSGKWPKS